MANILYKSIYNISAGVPALLFLALAWHFQDRTSIIPIIFFVIAGILIVSMLGAFLYAKNHVATDPIHIKNISPSDKKAAIHLITYAIPFATLVLDDLNPVICVIIVLIIILFAMQMNTPLPNPILFLLGYHFYSIHAENGSEYLLISKGTLRTKEDLKIINQIFEFLLINTEE